MTAPRLPPIRLLDVEVAAPLPAIAPATADDGSVYTVARLLVRCHGRPLGILDTSLPGGALPASELAVLIGIGLGAELRAHLRADGLPAAALTAAGAAGAVAASALAAGGAGADATGALPDLPPCLAGRRAALADAPAITVVIPTHGRPQRVVGAVAAVLDCDYPPQLADVVVVDNTPPDDATRTAVARAFGDERRVRYLRCDTPGSAAARNAGAALARGELVAFADDDVLADRDWLAELATAFADDPLTDCVTGAILPLELETPAQQLVERFGGFHKGFAPQRWSLREPPAGEPLFPFTAGRFGSGGNVAFRTAALRALGGYDELLGNGTPSQAGEDFELLLRTVRAGHRLAYQPTAEVRHLHRRSDDALDAVIASYGTAITAVLTRTVVHDPRAALEIARRLPAAAVYLLSSSSAKNAGHAGDYPLRLRLLELKGLLLGPFAYLRSRLAARRRRKLG